MAALLIGSAATAFALDLSRTGSGWSPVAAAATISPGGTTLTSSSTATQLTITAGDTETWRVEASVAVQRTDLGSTARAPNFFVKGTGDGTATVGSIAWASSNFVTLGAGPELLFSGEGSRSDIPLQYRTVVSFEAPAGSYEYTVTYTISTP